MQPPELRYFLDPGTVLHVQKREFRKAFWFWDGTENAKTVFLAHENLQMSTADMMSALNLEKCKLKTKEIWKEKLRKSENVEREENSTACENASCA